MPTPAPPHPSGIMCPTRPILIQGTCPWWQLLQNGSMQPQTHVSNPMNDQLMFKCLFSTVFYSSIQSFFAQILIWSGYSFIHSNLYSTRKTRWDSKSLLQEHLDQDRQQLQHISKGTRYCSSSGWSIVQTLAPDDISSSTRGYLASFQYSGRKRRCSVHFIYCMSMTETNQFKTPMWHNNTNEVINMQQQTSISCVLQGKMIVSTGFQKNKIEEKHWKTCKINLLKWLTCILLPPPSRG